MLGGVDEYKLGFEGIVYSDDEQQDTDTAVSTKQVPHGSEIGNITVQNPIQDEHCSAPFRTEDLLGVPSPLVSRLGAQRTSKVKTFLDFRNLFQLHIVQDKQRIKEEREEGKFHIEVWEHESKDRLAAEEYPREREETERIEQRERE